LIPESNRRIVTKLDFIYLLPSANRAVLKNSLQYNQKSDR